MIEKGANVNGETRNYKLSGGNSTVFTLVPCLLGLVFVSDVIGHTSNSTHFLVVLLECCPLGKNQTVSFGRLEFWEGSFCWDVRRKAGIRSRRRWGPPLTLDPPDSEPP